MTNYTLNANQYSQANRVKAILNQLCAGSTRASGLLGGKIINLVAPKKGSTGGQAKGKEIYVDFMPNAREMAESIIFEASNAAHKQQFRTNENKFKQQGVISLEEYARKKATIEYESTCAVANVLLDMESKTPESYKASPWGQKQLNSSRRGAQNFAIAPHDNRPEQTDPIMKMRTKDMYAWNIIRGIEAYKLEIFLQKIASLRCKKYLEGKNVKTIVGGATTEVTAENILKKTIKNSLVVYPSYIALLELLQKDPDWIVNTNGKTLRDCQFTEKMLMEARKINPNAGKINIFPRVVKSNNDLEILLRKL